MSTTLTTPDGELIEKPTRDNLAHALELLLHGDDPNADLWVENDEGWALSVVPTADLFFENVHEGDDYLTLGPLPESEILRLLDLFVQGDIQALRSEPWESGEG